MRRLEVELAGERHTLLPGQEFTMGRVGDLVIDDNPYLHRHFLKLSFAEGFWWLANVGARATAQLSDAVGLSRSTLTPGAKMPLVFGNTAVTFSAGPYCYELNLMVDEPAYEPITPETPASGDTTVGATTFTDSQLLAILALAEPLLRRTGTGAWQVPTAVQAARRLGWTQTRFNRKLDNVCDKLDRAGVRGLKGRVGKQALNRRAVLAEYAVNSRLVTAEHLPALDTEAAANVLSKEATS
ncbi:hypothetical protein [Tessaracoccus caeni]|uniref:hypothetical protein n=1 Tax=Tessaracoccus caeni TaxID=3031239 RepID=UPI0023DBAC11|nr:hypothetical protein [Tessaracoccus caeni]MDF1487699.1 hypothetical protein [Tessaracoccus caeni]